MRISSITITTSKLRSRYIRDKLHRMYHAVIYTDGACSNNGRPNARAGIGVYWPGNQQNNISRPLCLQGRQTNQRAEIEAARVGIEQAEDLGYDSVTVRSDSHYVIKAATEWIPNWVKNNWRQRIINYHDFIKLSAAMERIHVDFEYIPSEKNLADPLARAGVDMHQ